MRRRRVARIVCEARGASPPVEPRTHRRGFSERPHAKARTAVAAWCRAASALAARARAARAPRARPRTRAASGATAATAAACRANRAADDSRPRTPGPRVPSLAAREAMGDEDVASARRTYTSVTTSAARSRSRVALDGGSAARTRSAASRGAGTPESAQPEVFEVAVAADGSAAVGNAVASASASLSGASRVAFSRSRGSPASMASSSIPSATVACASHAGYSLAHRATAAARSVPDASNSGAEAEASAFPTAADPPAATASGARGGRDENGRARNEAARHERTSANASGRDANAAPAYPRSSSAAASVPAWSISANRWARRSAAAAASRTAAAAMSGADSDAIRSDVNVAVVRVDADSNSAGLDARPSVSAHASISLECARSDSTAYDATSRFRRSVSDGDGAEATERGEGARSASGADVVEEPRARGGEDADSRARAPSLPEGERVAELGKQRRPVAASATAAESPPAVRASASGSSNARVSSSAASAAAAAPRASIRRGFFGGCAHELHVDVELGSRRRGFIGRELRWSTLVSGAGRSGRGVAEGRPARAPPSPRRACAAVDAAAGCDERAEGVQEPRASVWSEVGSSARSRLEMQKLDAKPKPRTRVSTSSSRR